MRSRLSFPIVTLLLLALVLSPGLAAGAGAMPAHPAAPTPDGVFVVRIYYNTVEDSKLLHGFDLFEYNNQVERYFLAAVDRAGLKRLEALGFRTAVDEAETANFARLSVPWAEAPDTIPGYSCYRTVEETYAAAQALVTSHPTLATWIDVGNSWEKSAGQLDGYDMMVLKLTNSAITGAKPKLFITASIHAREYTPAETATRFAEYLVNNYGVNPDATWILDHHEIHLMLQANPDGRKEAEGGTSWRKNTNENYCGVTSSSRGADLNRNYTFKWGCCGGSSTSACDETYRGPTASSEPETQAVQAYMAAIFPDQRGTGDTDAAPADATGMYIDLHSYAQLVLWPWGWTSTNSPNFTQLQTLGRKLAYFNGYTPEKSYTLYATDGTTDDHAYGVYGVASYCIEMGTAFFESCSTFEGTTYPTNLQALLYAAKTPRTPYITPLGPDALSLALSASAVTIGAPTTLTATINDTRYLQTNGTEPTQNIAAAEYYVDVPPWQTGAVAHAMTAVDGSFNSTIENVTASVSTSTLAPGKHIIFVRGKDANNNWGAFSAIFLETRMFTMTSTSQAICAPANATFTVDVGYAASVTLSAAGYPAGATAAFVPNPVTGPAASTLTIGNTGAAAAGSYTINVTGSSGSYNQTTPVQLEIANAVLTGPTLATPLDGSMNAATTPTLTWNAVAGAASYTLQMATDPAFSSLIINQGGLTATSYTPGSALSTDTMYYWRVTAVNGCGSKVSTTWAFRTAATGCVTHTSTDVPKTVPPSGTSGTTTSNVTVPSGGGTITDVNVTIGQLTHTYDGDLSLYILHPDSTSVTLSTNNGGSGDNYTNTVFDDEATTNITSGSPPFTGSYKPEGSLATLDGKPSAGTWTLRIVDGYTGDSGTLTAWSLTICGAAASATADYSDLASSYGAAWHTGSGALRLGTAWTSDTSFTAGHDDVGSGDASDDGVTRGAFSTSNGIVNLTVNGATGYVTGWFDWNQDGDFSDAGEQVFTNQAVGAGSTMPVTFSTDGNSVYGKTLNARFRVYASTQTQGPDAAPLAYGGIANGEVEDYTWYFSPLAVELASFTAETTGAGVTLAWETVSETDNTGFNVYRSGSEAGSWTRVNEMLIPALTPGSAQGNAYTWTDATTLAAGTTWYMLEDVDLNGTATRHEPVSVTVTEPNAVGMAGFGGYNSGLAGLYGLLALAATALAGVATRRRR